MIFEGSDSNSTLVYTQPEVYDYEDYSWSVTLHNNTLYTLVLSDKYDDSWSIDSSLVIKVGNEEIGSYTLNSGKIQTFYFTIGYAPFLLISQESDCSRLTESHWSYISVNEGLCNSMTSNLVISDYSSLVSLVVKRNALKNVNGLFLRNIPHLKRLVFEDDGNKDTGAFANVKEIELSSNRREICVK